MNNHHLKESWKKDEAMSFKGWDFTYLNHRWEEEPLPWDYENLIKEYLKPDHQLLDMGTGGGEFLLSLNHPYEKTSVTEMWEPNVQICKENLSPLGVEVKQIFDDSHLPFADNSFDFIINRHDSYDAKEVKRILKPDGLFLTQQVGSENNLTLSKKLIINFTPLYMDNNLTYRTREIEEEGFEIIKKEEYFPYLHFYDVGAVVFFAKVIQWEFPDFSVDKCFVPLLELNKELNEKGFIESLEHRFILLCKNQK